MFSMPTELSYSGHSVRELNFDLNKITNERGGKLDFIHDCVERSPSF